MTFDRCQPCARPAAGRPRRRLRGRGQVRQRRHDPPAAARLAGRAGRRQPAAARGLQRRHRHPPLPGPAERRLGERDQRLDGRRRLAGLPEAAAQRQRLDAALLQRRLLLDDQELQQGADRARARPLRRQRRQLAASLTAKVDYFRYIQPDRTPPQISGITVTPNGIGAQVSWTTDEAATSNVDYGPTSSYGSTVGKSSFETSHTLAVAPLACATTITIASGRPMLLGTLQFRATRASPPPPAQARSARTSSTLRRSTPASGRSSTRSATRAPARTALRR